MPMSPGSHTASLFLDFPASKLKSPSDSHALVESQPQWYTVCNQPRDDSPLHLGIYPKLGISHMEHNGRASGK